MARLSSNEFMLIFCATCARYGQAGDEGAHFEQLAGCVYLCICLQMCPSNRTSRSSSNLFVQFSIFENWTENPSNFSSKGKLDEHFRPIFKACS